MILRLPLFLLFWLQCFIARHAAALVTLMSRRFGDLIGAHAARVAGLWFAAGTGWGGDDVVLSSLREDSRLTYYVREEAKRQRDRGLQFSFLLFLERVSKAGDHE
jgi:hypothetical protein